MALSLDPNNHVLYSNRSAAYTNLGDFKSALQDADRVIQLNPSWSRVNFSPTPVSLLGLLPQRSRCILARTARRILQSIQKRSRTRTRYFQITIYR
jgi:tetratricopeptide (TPR) repeat protein